MVALGSLQSKVERKKPGSSIEIDENSHIGRHLLKKRLELGMWQKDVAKLLGVTAESIGNWENGFSEPQIQFNPAIIAFLGYVPFPVSKESSAQKIKSYRLLNGLSHKQLGKLLGVDAASISCWENNKNMPRKHSLKRLNKLLTNEE